METAKKKIKTYYPNGGTPQENVFIEHIERIDSDPTLSTNKKNICVVRAGVLGYRVYVEAGFDEADMKSADNLVSRMRAIETLIDHRHIHYTHFLPKEFLNIAVKYEPKLKPLQELVNSREVKFFQSAAENKLKRDQKGKGWAYHWY